MKITVERPKQIEGELQLNPTIAYIQGNKSQAIQVKFCPKEDFLRKHPEYKDSQRPDVTGAFRIPMRVVGTDQVLPVNTVLIGTLTSDEVAFEPQILAFGQCFVGSSASCNLRIFNKSTLPQRYAFVRMPSFLTVEDIPHDVIHEQKADDKNWGHGTAVVDGGGRGVLGTLLPQEIKDVNIIYSPESATEMDYKVTIKAISGGLAVRDFSIECKGQGRIPPLSLSHSSIEMASIPSGATCKESIEVTNSANVPYTLNLLLPPVEIAAIYASPVCCTLKPKETRRVQIEFKPNQAYMRLLEGGEEPKVEEVVEEATEGDVASPAPAALPTPGEDEVVEPEEPAETPEEYRVRRLRDIREHHGRRWMHSKELGDSVHCTWKLPIHVRQKVVTQPGGAQQAEDAANDRRSQVSMLYLGLTTCALPSVLVPEPAVLDFGEVTAGQRTTLSICMTNHLPEKQQLHMEPLPENACFTVLNAPREVGSKEFKLVVEFKPQFAQIYQSALRLWTQNTRIQIPLRGKGVRPVLKIEPADGVLQLGSVVYSKDATDYVTANLSIINDSDFELKYKLDAVIPAQKNDVGVQPFTLTPLTGKVDANGRQIVQVTFRPHRPLGVFREKLLVDVPNQKEPTYVYLYGHCFHFQTFALHDIAFAPFGAAQLQRPKAFVDALAVGTGSSLDATGKFTFKSAQDQQFDLRFEHGESTKYLLVGACSDPGTPLAPQKTAQPTFQFEIEKSEFSQYFAVEVADQPAAGGKPDPKGGATGSVVKGSPLPGKAPMRIAFKYQPPEDASLTLHGMNLEDLGGIGQWITCKVNGELGGGSAPASQNPIRKITVELKAYLQQI